MCSTYMHQEEFSSSFGHDCRCPGEDPDILARLPCQDRSALSFKDDMTEAEMMAHGEMGSDGYPTGFEDMRSNSRRCGEDTCMT